MPLEFNYLGIVSSIYLLPFLRGGIDFSKIGYKGKDTKQSIKKGMSKCQKEEVTQRGKREVFVYRRKQ